MHVGSLFDSCDARDGMLASGMDVGYAKLDGLLAAGSV